MTRKAVVSYELGASVEDRVRALLQGLDDVINELIVEYDQDAIDVIDHCDDAVDEAVEEHYARKGHV